MPHLEDYRRRRVTESYWPADTSRPLLDWTLGEALRHAAVAVPDRLALVEGLKGDEPSRRWTYAEHYEQSRRIAAALLTRFKPGERVAFWAHNVPEWQLMLYGCAMAGVVLVTVNPAYKARELEYVLGKSRASGLFVMDAYRGYDCLKAVEDVRTRLPELREVCRIADFSNFVAAAPSEYDLPEIGQLDPCVIMFTSGTTGAQKGVIFHHRGIVNMALFTQERGGLKEGGVFVNPMPMFHIGALGHAAVGAVTLRATHVLQAEWSPEFYMSLVEREGGTYSLLVPTMIEAVLASPRRADYDLSTLKNLVSGAAVVEAHLIRRTFEEVGCEIVNIFGQTEMQGVAITVHLDDSIEDKSETIGQALPHAEVKIADPATGDVLPLDTQGEICVRGYQTMIGYFDMPEETAKALSPDGWLRSGDLGSMDSRGFVKITGRIKDMIIRGGENVYPREIENLLLENPKIANVAVVGVPDQRWGEQVGAVIMPKSMDDCPDALELHNFCRESLAHYKTPRLWYFVDDMPWTETGKLQKFKLVNAIKSGEMKPSAQT
ncbi:MAG: AMP-binding protein [Rhodobiaceae bacterium]|nr:AMP-binding protein [Rhodobiaceae bacterium]MCC0054515.1 AMP-binding protein [Rhodobiaceae bacterium]